MTSNYQVDVEDFGPIAKASVDVRPMTVFVGPSNTGKSYLAVLLYALHQCLGAAATTYGRRFSPARSWIFDVPGTQVTAIWTRNSKKPETVGFEAVDDGTVPGHCRRTWPR